MLDLKLAKDGDLELTNSGDVLLTDSIRQAVRIRLLWFLGEWRLGPDMGFPYFEEVLIKNPSETKIRHLIRKTIMEVDGVTDVISVKFDIDNRTRRMTIEVIFCTKEETYAEEVNILWQAMA